MMKGVIDYDVCLLIQDVVIDYAQIIVNYEVRET